MVNDVTDEECQMVLRQPVTQVWWKQIGLIEVVGFELPHALHGAGLQTVKSMIRSSHFAIRIESEAGKQQRYSTLSSKQGLRRS